MTNTEKPARLWKPGTTEVIDGNPFILTLPERACGCHPAMPCVRTTDGWACQGCGVGA